MSWPDNVTKSDLKIERIRGSGPGGQNRNKRDTAIRITHKPTGLVGYSEDERSQLQNQKKAFKRLADKLVPLMKIEIRRRSFVPETVIWPNDILVQGRVDGEWVALETSE